MSRAGINKLVKAILMSVLIFISIFALVLSNITYNYPLEELCEEIRKYYLERGEFPKDLKGFKSYKRVKYFSKLVYRPGENDFILYFCETKIAPCLVCSNKMDPHFEEI